MFSFHLSVGSEAEAALVALLERAESARLRRAIYDSRGTLFWPDGAAKVLSEHIATLSAADFHATPESEELLGALVSMRSALVRWYAEETARRQDEFSSLLRAKKDSTLSGNLGPDPSGESPNGSSG